LAGSSKTVLEPDLDKRSGRGSLPGAINMDAVRRPEQVSSVAETGRQSGVLHAYSGNALLQRNKFSEAEIELKQATAEEPDNAEWQALLGYSLFKQKRYAEASRALEAAVILEPENARYKEILKESKSLEKR
jgi:predicted Zn-dependent protease